MKFTKAEWEKIFSDERLARNYFGSANLGTPQTPESMFRHAGQQAAKDYYQTMSLEERAKLAREWEKQSNDFKNFQTQQNIAQRRREDQLSSSPSNNPFRLGVQPKKETGDGWLGALSNFGQQGKEFLQNRPNQEPTTLPNRRNLRDEFLTTQNQFSFPDHQKKNPEQDTRFLDTKVGKAAQWTGNALKDSTQSVIDDFSIPFNFLKGVATKKDYDERRTTAEKLGANYRTSFYNVLEGQSGVLGYLGEKTGNKTLQQAYEDLYGFSQKAKDGFEQTEQKEFEWSDIGTKDFYVDKASLLSADIMASLAGGAGMVKLMSKIPRVAAGAKGLTGKVFNFVAGGIGMTIPETSKFAGGVYNQATQLEDINNTDAFEEAFVKDALLSLSLNTLTVAGALTKLPRRLQQLANTSELGKMTEIGARLGAGSTLEGTQEVLQNKIEADALKQDFKWLSPDTYEAFALGAVAGTATTGGMMAASQEFSTEQQKTVNDKLKMIDDTLEFIGNVQNEVLNTMTSEERTRFEKALEVAEQQGLDGQDIIDFAWEDFSNNGGQERIEQATINVIKNGQIEQDVKQETPLAPHTQYANQFTVGEEIFYKGKDYKIKRIQDGAILLEDHKGETFTPNTFDVRKKNQNPIQKDVPKNQEVEQEPDLSFDVDEYNVGDTVSVAGLSGDFKVVDNSDNSMIKLVSSHGKPLTVGRDNVTFKQKADNTIIQPTQTTNEMSEFKDTLRKELQDLEMTPDEAIAEVEGQLSRERDPDEISRLQEELAVLKEIAQEQIPKEPPVFTGGFQNQPPKKQPPPTQPLTKEQFLQKYNENPLDITTAEMQQEHRRWKEEGKPAGHPFFSNQQENEVSQEKTSSPDRYEYPDYKTAKANFERKRVANKINPSVEFNKDIYEQNRAHREKTRKSDIARGETYITGDHVTFYHPTTNELTEGEVAGFYGEPTNTLEIEFEDGSRVQVPIEDIHDHYIKHPKDVPNKTEMTVTNETSLSPVQVIKKLNDENNLFQATHTRNEKPVEVYWFKDNKGRSFGTFREEGKKWVNPIQEKQLEKILKPLDATEVDASAQEQLREMQKNFAFKGSTSAKHKLKLLKEMQSFADENGLELSDRYKGYIEKFEAEIEAERETKKKEIEAEEKRQRDYAEQRKREKEAKQKAEEELTGEHEHIHNELMKRERYQELSAKERKSLISKIQRMDRNVFVVLSDTSMSWDVYNAFQKTDEKEFSDLLTNQDVNDYKKGNHEVIFLSKEFVANEPTQEIAQPKVVIEDTDETKAVRALLDEHPDMTAEHIQDELMWQEISLPIQQIQEIINQHQQPESTPSETTPDVKTTRLFDEISDIERVSLLSLEAAITEVMNREGLKTYKEFENFMWKHYSTGYMHVLTKRFDGYMKLKAKVEELSGLTLEQDVEADVQKEQERKDMETAMNEAEVKRNEALDTIAKREAEEKARIEKEMNEQGDATDYTVTDKEVKGKWHYTVEFNGKIDPMVERKMKSFGFKKVRDLDPRRWEANKVFTDEMGEKVRINLAKVKAPKQDASSNLSIMGHSVTVEKSKHTQTGADIWLVKFTGDVDNWSDVRTFMRKNKGQYYNKKFKVQELRGAFAFKQDPSAIFDKTQSEPKQETNPPTEESAKTNVQDGINDVQAIRWLKEKAKTFSNARKFADDVNIRTEINGNVKSYFISTMGGKHEIAMGSNTTRKGVNEYLRDLWDDAQFEVVQQPEQPKQTNTFEIGDIVTNKKTPTVVGEIEQNKATPDGMVSVKILSKSVNGEVRSTTQRFWRIEDTEFISKDRIEGYKKVNYDHQPKPPLDIIDESLLMPEVDYKDTKTRITATFTPVQRPKHSISIFRNEPTVTPKPKTLVFPKGKDKDGYNDYLRLPAGVSVADINDWLNIEFYQEGVTSEELIATFDYMNGKRETTLTTQESPKSNIEQGVNDVQAIRGLKYTFGTKETNGETFTSIEGGGYFGLRPVREFLTKKGLKEGKGFLFVEGAVLVKGTETNQNILAELKKEVQPKITQTDINNLAFSKKEYEKYSKLSEDEAIEEMFFSRRFEGRTKDIIEDHLKNDRKNEARNVFKKDASNGSTSGINSYTGHKQGYSSYDHTLTFNLPDGRSFELTTDQLFNKYVKRLNVKESETDVDPLFANLPDWDDYKNKHNLGKIFKDPRLMPEDEVLNAVEMWDDSYLSFADEKQRKAYYNYLEKVNKVYHDRWKAEQKKPKTKEEPVTKETNSKVRLENESQQPTSHVNWLEKPKKRSHVNFSLQPDEAAILDLLPRIEQPLFLKAIVEANDPRLVHDQYVKHQVSRGRSVDIDGKEFKDLYNDREESNIDQLRKDLLGYGKGLTEDGTFIQVTMSPDGEIHLVFDPKSNKESQTFNYDTFANLVNNDVFSFGKVGKPVWLDDPKPFLTNLKGGTNDGISNAGNTRGTIEGTSTAEVQGTATNTNVDATSETSRKPTHARPERNHDDTVRNPSDERVPKEREGSSENTTSNPRDAAGRPIQVNHQITQDIYEQNAKKRFSNNIEALKVIQTLEKEKRYATEAEREVIAKYQGWGGLPQYFTKGKPEYDVMQGYLNEGLFTQEDFNDMSASTTTSFFTNYSIASKMYQVLESAGFKGGKVLESSVGSGMFLGALPDNMRSKTKFTTTDKTKISHLITKHLYPKNNIHYNKPFESLALPENSFDVVIGNVPFGRIKMSYPRYAKKGMEWANKNIHNFFITRNLDLLREGGIGVIITSTSSMDNTQSHYKEFRKYLQDHVDMLEVVRLPNQAFKDAGTSVATDIIFFRKKSVDSKKTPSDITTFGFNSGVYLQSNQYFIENPDFVIGDMVRGTNQYGEAVIDVKRKDTFEKDLSKVITKIKNKFKHAFDETKNAKDELFELQNQINEDWATMEKGLHDGAIHVKNGKFVQFTLDKWMPFDIPAKDADKTKAAIAIRDLAQTIFQKERNKDIPTKEITPLRDKLNTLYDAFVKKHGYLSQKGTLTPLAKDTTTVSLLTGLERKTENGYEKTDFFHKRLQFPDVVAEPKTWKEALTLSISTRGELDIPFMADLMKTDEETTLASLEKDTLVYYDPQKETYVLAEEYLSGNIADRLEFVKGKPEYKKQEEALNNILPAQLTSDQVVDGVRFGQTWIPPDVYKSFIEKELGLKNVDIQYDFKVASWSIKGEQKHNPKNTQEYGLNEGILNETWDGLKIIQAMMNQRPIKASIREARLKSHQTKEIERQRLDSVLKRKSELLLSKFHSFIQSNPNVSDRLTNLYNRKFNSIVLRTYDGELYYGKDHDPKRFVGLNPIYEPYKHQKDTTVRILQSQNTLLAHVVGAGKTLEMQLAIMEGRRLGLIKKPLLVVPALVYDQHIREFQHAYPNAKIKPIKTGTKKGDIPMVDEKYREGRYETLADVMYNDYDVIIMTTTAFERLSMSNQYMEQFILNQIEILRNSMKSLDKGSQTVKDLETAISNLQTQLNDKVNKDDKDVAIPFEMLGVDALFVDEAHYYKNLFYHSKMGNVAGLSNSNAKRSFDMYMKTQYMNDIGAKIVFATGTPVANSVGEMFTMMRYLAPKQLQALDMEHFDAWASQFGQVINSVELNTSGKFIDKARFSQFNNVPELMDIFKSFSDVKMADDLPYLKRPKAERIKVKTKMSDNQRTFLEIILLRALKVQGGVDKEIDNPLKLTGEGKKLALDYRVIDGIAPNETESKLNEIASVVLEEYNNTTKGNKGEDKKGNKVTFDNGAQIVFMDLGVPKNDDNQKSDDDADNEGMDIESASMYQNLKDRMIELGIKEHEIAFVHDYNTPAKKKKLSDLVNDGKIRVLIGSTGKLGVGVNIQKRLTAIHHADPTWRPADIEQREGRLIRQGNLNPNVRVYTHVTEGSFDAIMWNTLETKAKFIAQVLSGGSKVRTLEEIAEHVLSFSEIKAEATNNKAMKQLMEEEKNIRELKALENDHYQEQAKHQRALKENPEKIAKYEKELVDFKVAEETAVDIRGDKFEITIGKEVITDREKAREGIVKIAKSLGGKMDTDFKRTVAQLGNLHVMVTGKEYSLITGKTEFDITVELVFKGEHNTHTLSMMDLDMFIGSKGSNIFGRYAREMTFLLDNYYSRNLTEKINQAKEEVAFAEKNIGKRFEQKAELEQKVASIADLRDEARKFELSNSFDTVYRANGKNWVITDVDYKKVESADPKKRKKEKMDVHVIVKAKEVKEVKENVTYVDEYGVEHSVNVFVTGDEMKIRDLDFIRGTKRLKDVGISDVTYQSRLEEIKRLKKQREEEAKEREKNQDEIDNDDYGDDYLLNEKMDGGTDRTIPPKVAKKVADRLANALDTVLRTGNVKSKALGTFNKKRGSGNVKGKELFNLRVTAHELGHAFDTHIGLKDLTGETIIRNELKNVAKKLYPSKKLTPQKQLSEGLAEIFQLYVIDHQAARQLAPATVNRINEFVSEHKGLQDAVIYAHEMIEGHEQGSEFSQVIDGSIHFKGDEKLDRTVGSEYAIDQVNQDAKGLEKAKEKTKGFFKRKLAEKIDFTIPFKDFQQALEKSPSYVKEKDVNIVKKLRLAGAGHATARQNFTSWAMDKFNRYIIHYQTFSELPTYLHNKFYELEALDPTKIKEVEGYKKRFKSFYKENVEKKGMDKAKAKEQAALDALSSRSLQEVALEGILEIERVLRGKDVTDPAILDALDALDDQTKGETSFKVLSAIMASYRYAERYAIKDKQGNQKFPDNPISEELAKNVIEKSEKLFPNLRPVIEEYTTNLSEILLEKAVKGGLVTEKAKETVKKGSSFYIPTYKASVNQSPAGETKDRKTVGKTVKAYEGSKEVVLNFLDASMYKLLETETAIEFKDVLNQLEHGLKHDKMGKFGQIVNQQVYVQKFGGKQIEDQVLDIFETKLNLDMSNLEGSLANNVFDLFMKKEMLSGKEPVVMNWTYDDKGKHKPTYMKIAPDMYTSLMSMKPLEVGAIMRTFAQTSSIARYMALSTGSYMYTAITRDASTTYMHRNAKGSFIKGVIHGALLASGEVDPKIVDDYINSKAYMSNAESVLQSFTTKNVTDGLLPTGSPTLWKLNNGKYIKFINPLNAASSALSWNEQFSRYMAFYQMAEQRALEEGISFAKVMDGREKLTPEELIKVEKVLTDAAFEASEITTNFRLHGTDEDFRKMAMPISFLQGSLQGIYREWGEVRKNPKRVGARLATGLIPLTLLAWAASRALGDEYEDIPSHLRDRYWIFPAPWGYHTMSKPFTYSIPIAFVERALDHILGKEGARKIYEDFHQPFVQNLGVPILPIQIQTSVEVWANKAWYGGDIVSRYEQDKPNFMQYDDKTSEFAKMMSRVQFMLRNGKDPYNMTYDELEEMPLSKQNAGFSPKKVDYFIQGVFGAYGKTFLEYVGGKPKSEGNALLGTNRNTHKDRMGSRSVIQFYDKLRGMESAHSYKGETGNPSDNLKTMRQQRDAMKAIKDFQKELALNKEVNAKEKSDLDKKLNKAHRDVSRLGNGLTPSDYNNMMNVLRALGVVE